MKMEPLLSVKLTPELKETLDGLKLHHRMSYDDTIRELVRCADMKKMWREVMNGR